VTTFGPRQAPQRRRDGAVIRRAVALAGAALISTSVAAGEGRLAPPDNLGCPRDRLTAFEGKVLSYSRGAETIRLEVRTDEATTERFALGFAKAEGPAARMLLRGRPFREADWKTIESRPGRLRPGMRVIVWVCEGEPRPMFDWRPGEDAGDGAPTSPR